MRTRATSVKMARLVARWRRSGETQAGFARRHHIPAWTFWYWCRKLAVPPTIPTADVFVPVQVAPEDPTSGLEIVFASGDRLRVPPGTKADLLQTTITALRSRC
jgi:hypothetical protein